MTDFHAEIPEGTPLTDIPALVLGTTAVAGGLVALFAAGYLVADPAAQLAWVIGGVAVIVCLIAGAIAILKGASA